MAEPSRQIGDQEFAGAVTFTGQVSFPAGTVDEDSMDASANLPHTILTHRMGIRTAMPTTEPILSESRIVHTAYRDGTILGVNAAVYTIADSTGRTVTLDILKSTGGTTGTSILSSPLVFNSTNSTDRVTRTATLSGVPTLLAGNLIIHKITVAGSTGVQALGLLSEVTIAQDPVS